MVPLAWPRSQRLGGAIDGVAVGLARVVLVDGDERVSDPPPRGLVVQHQRPPRGRAADRPGPFPTELLVEAGQQIVGVVGVHQADPARAGIHDQLDVVGVQLDA